MPNPHGSHSTWTRSWRPARDYWRGRERSWRALRIFVLRTEGKREHFNRYDYGRLWDRQRGLCGVCDKPLPTTRKESVPGWGEVGVGSGISVDHDHTTHLVRALVHGFCNRDVGSLDKTRALLVLNYLLRHEALA